MSSTNIPVDDKEDVAEGIANVIHYSPRDKLETIFRAFTTDIANSLHDIVSKGRPTEDDEVVRVKEIRGTPFTLTLLLELLDRLRILVAHVHPNDMSREVDHPCILVLKDFWTILDPLLDIYGHIPQISEAFARLIKAAIDSYTSHFAPLLAPVLLKTMNCYKNSNTQNSAYLWIVRNCVKEFEYEDSVHSTALYQYVDAIVGYTFGNLNGDVNCIQDGTLSLTFNF
jgi:hypothetical protein